MRNNGVGTTRQAAENFGFVDNRGAPSIRAFLVWAKANKIKPEYGTVHHFWWNFKEIAERLDNKGIPRTESVKVDYAAMFREDLNGGHQSGLFD